MPRGIAYQGSCRLHHARRRTCRWTGRSSLMIQARRFGHATFETPDIDRQINYFTQVAGLVLAEGVKGRAYLATKLGDLVVQLEKGEQSRCVRLAFQTDPATELDEIRR